MANTIAKYLAKIYEATATTGIYAYRGQHDYQWPLYSAATRRLIQDQGASILHEPDFPQQYMKYHREVLIEPARTRGFGNELGHRLSDLQLLAKLQHFGAATGLLDFTWSPLVALWFACEDDSVQGKVFIVNTGDPLRVAKIPSNEGAQDTTAVFAERPGTPRLLYWEPMVSGDSSARILRQRSVFVIGRPIIPDDLETLSEIEIEKDDKKPLKAELKTLDIHRESLFQDVYGFAQASTTTPLPSLSPEEYQLRGNRYYQQGEFVHAVHAYSRSIELAPDVGLTYLLRGNAYAASGSFQEAIVDYDEAEDRIDQLQHAMRHTAYFNRANSKSKLLDYEGALKDYDEAIKLSGSNPACYFNRGNTHADLHKFSKAVLDYDRVTGRVARNAAFNKGNAYLAMGQLKDARRCYEDAVAMGAEHVGIGQNRRTLDRIIPLVEEIDYTVRADSDPQTGDVRLQFTVPEGAKDVKHELVSCP